MAGRRCWLMRMDPEGADLVPKALALGMLLTGWSRASDLVKLVDQEAFKEHGIRTYFPDARRPWTQSQVTWISGAYRFLHKMKLGDLVVVPQQDHFYIACVTGAATYADGVADDSAHRRPAVCGDVLQSRQEWGADLRAVESIWKPRLGGKDAIICVVRNSWHRLPVRQGWRWA